MTPEHIDPADELDRFAHEAKEGRSGTMRDTPESLTLAAAAKELRTLRAELAEAVEACQSAANLCGCRDGKVRVVGQVGPCPECSAARAVVAKHKATP